ncbi:MAG: nucleotide sugar dehydrogenase [Actinomycetota bacterium]|nr:nucleotide sugar dehydrogenase [Actinomycetota bacterium]
MVGQRIAVFGLGYVGLPLIGACIEAGHQVVGFDVNEAVVVGLAAGESHVDDIASDLVGKWLGQGFHPTNDINELTDIDVFIICVPTPLSADGSPDLRAVQAATAMIAGHIDAAKRPLVVLESTTYPGTTEEVVKPILERNGFKATVDFSLAFSPERIDPGNRRWNFSNTPKVVGGFSTECADRAEQFYLTLTEQVVRTKGLKEAEMAKLLENTYRHVNIALVNELAKVSHLLGIDFWDVIAAAETKPYGFHAFRPGPGVGGHCIPIDPNYLGHRVRTELGQSLRFVELAQEINASMPNYVVHRLQELLNQESIELAGASVLLLGITYKANIADLRESPSIAVLQELRRQGALVTFHDPYVEEWIVDEVMVPKAVDLPAAAALADCAVLLQAHDCYLIPQALATSPRLLDTQGRLGSTQSQNARGWVNL